MAAGPEPADEGLIRLINTDTPSHTHAVTHAVDVRDWSSRRSQAGPGWGAGGEGQRSQLGPGFRLTWCPNRFSAEEAAERRTITHVSTSSGLLAKSYLGRTSRRRESEESSFSWIPADGFLGTDSLLWRLHLTSTVLMRDIGGTRLSSWTFTGLDFITAVICTFRC